MAATGVADRVDTRSATQVLKELLTQKEVRYALEHPKCKEAAEMREKSGIPGGNNRASIFFDPFPLTWTGGEGATLLTVDGQKITDFQGNMTAGLFGPQPVVVKEAVQKVMNDGWCLGGHNENEEKVAREFTSRFPCLDMVKFCNTGTEATQYALSTARAVSGKSKVLMYTGAYHGATIHGVPSEYMPLDTPYEKVMVPYSPDPTGICNAIREHAKELACVIFEPITLSPYAYLKQLAPKEYLQAVRQTCTECAVALIFDEVMTSRLSPGGAQLLTGVTPDLCTFGKYFAGGLNFGAFGGKKEWMERHNPRHPKSIASGGTFNQNAVCMAAAAAVLEHLWTPKMCTDHNAKGDRFRERINEISDRHGAPCQAYGQGSLINIIWQGRNLFSKGGQIDADKNSGLVGTASSLFFFHMLEKGMLVGVPKLTYMTLPTPLTDADYENFLKEFESFLVEYKVPLSLLVAETNQSKL